MHRHPQTIGRQLQGFSQKLPGKLNRLAFEVIAKTEVAQHLKESVVARGITHILEIVVLAASSHTFLRGDGPLIRALLEPQKRLFELIHARIGKQQRGVIRRHQ